LELCGFERKPGSCALIEMGAEQTRVVILKDGHPQLMRDIALGSAHVTRALVGVTVSEQGEVALDVVRAEQIKRAHGIVTEPAEGAADGELSFVRLVALMRPVLENLLTELARLFDFYKVHVDGAGVTRILLCGGGARLRHLPEFLHEGLGIAVDRFEPLRVLQPSASGDEAGEGARLAAALGAALLHGRRMTLMPPALLALRRDTTMRIVLGAVTAALGTALVLSYALLRLMVWQGDQRVETAQREWDTLRPGYEQYLAMTREQQRGQDTLDAIHAFTNRQPLWEGVFKEISHLLPENIQLTELFASTEASRDPSSMALITLHLKGLVGGADSGAKGSLTALLKALDASLFFRDARLAGTHVQTGAGKTTLFDIVCHLDS
jgi:Tfp pilus assembly protein PilN